MAQRFSFLGNLLSKGKKIPLHVLLQFLEISVTSPHGSSLLAELLFCFSHFA